MNLPVNIGFFDREVVEGKAEGIFGLGETEGVLSPEWYDQYTQPEGTPMLLDQATPRNVLRAIKEINGFEWEGDFKPMARRALKELLENRLDQELADYLGVSRYERGARSARLSKWSRCQAPVDRDGRCRAFSAAQP